MFGGGTIKEEELKKVSSKLEKSKAIKAFNQKMMFRYLIIILLIIFVFLLLVFGATSLGVRENTFTIRIGDSSLSKIGYGSNYSHLIGLSEDDSFESSFTNLSFNGVHNMTNISVLDIPLDVDEGIGEHNGKNYLAYSFFLKNFEEESTITESIFIKSVSRNLDKAIRVRVYRNGLYLDYAKANDEGESEYNTTSFYSDEIVYKLSHNLDHGEIVKYTIVIWLEGDDPDCTNSLYGGMIKLGMDFNVDEK